jgi:hypothetical protein
MANLVDLRFHRWCNPEEIFKTVPYVDMFCQHFFVSICQLRNTKQPSCKNLVDMSVINARLHD